MLVRKWAIEKCKIRLWHSDCSTQNSSRKNITRKCEKRGWARLIKGVKQKIGGAFVKDGEKKHWQIQQRRAIGGGEFAAQRSHEAYVYSDRKNRAWIRKQTFEKRRVNLGLARATWIFKACLAVQWWLRLRHARIRANAESVYVVKQVTKVVNLD